jgi:hypothetical protein
MIIRVAARSMLVAAMFSVVCVITFLLLDLYT